MDCEPLARVTINMLAASDPPAEVLAGGPPCKSSTGGHMAGCPAAWNQIADEYWLGWLAMLM